MAQDHDERRSGVLDCVFHTAQLNPANDISRRPDDENIAQTWIEKSEQETTMAKKASDSWQLRFVVPQKNQCSMACRRRSARYLPAPSARPGQYGGFTRKKFCIGNRNRYKDDQLVCTDDCQLLSSFRPVSHSIYTSAWRVNLT